MRCSIREVAEEKRESADITHVIEIQMKGTSRIHKRRLHPSLPVTNTHSNKYKITQKTSQKNIHKPNTYSFPPPSCCNAHNALGLPPPSQLANFHHAQFTLPAPFTNPHLTNLGMGGQSAHLPPSYSASRFIKKKGTTSSVPAFITVFLPQVLNTAAAASASGVLGAGADGCEEKEAMVLISLWKWWEKAGWKEDMRDWRCVPFRAVGEGRVER